MRIFNCRKHWMRHGRLQARLAAIVVALAMASGASALDFKVDNVTVKEAVEQFQKQTGYVVAMDAQGLNLTSRISISVSNASPEKVMRRIFDGQSVACKVAGNTISVRKATATKRATSGAAAQPTGQRISGRVISANDGEPLIGVSVLNTSNKQAVTTDVEGNFTIVASKGNKLSFSYVGYKPVTRTVGSEKSMDVDMEESENVLDEVVVVGYGTQKKANLTGAVVSVDNEVFQRRPAANIARMLEGAVPGLNIRIDDPKPLRSSEFNVRGKTSINGGSALVLIDGVEGDPALLNPDDIENVSVLKDAASSAIYGARAPFGVVLITTKNPQQGRAKVTYSSLYSMQTPLNVPDVVTDGYVWAEHFYNSFFNASLSNPQKINTTQPFSLSWLDEYKRRHETGEFGMEISDGSIGEKGQYIYYPEGTDVFDELYKKRVFATTQNIAISGSDNRFDYYLSGRFFHYDGLFNSETKSDAADMYNMRFKAGFQATSWLKISNNFEFAYNKYVMPSASNYFWGNYMMAIQEEAHPSMPTRNPDGTLTTCGLFGVGAFLAGDTWKDMSNRQFKNTISFLSNIWKDNVTLQGDFTYNRSENYNMLHMSREKFSRGVNDDGTPKVETWSGIQSQLGETYVNRDYFAINIYAKYHQLFKQKHDVNFLIGWNYEKTHQKTVDISNQDLLTPDVDNMSLAMGTTTRNIKTPEWGNQFGGIFFRANYAYDNRYLLEVNGRYDSSSRFPSDRRWKMFPSASLGWRINQEHFWQVAPEIVSNLKIRGSWGQLGNANGLSNYLYKQTLTVVQGNKNLIFNGLQERYLQAPGAIPSSLTWETATTWDGGIDASFLNNRLSLSADYYVRKTTDMVTAGPMVQDVFGTSSPRGNHADMTTRGYEISLEWHDSFMLADKPFNYSIRANLSDYWSVIDKYNNPLKQLGTGNSAGYYEGMRIGEIWGFEVPGLWQTEEEIAAAEAGANAAGQQFYNPLWQNNISKKLFPGDIKVSDLNGNGYIDRGSNTVDDPGDRRIIGNSEPRYIYSFNLYAEWNGIWASAFFSGVGKQDWYPSNESSVMWGQYVRPYAQLPTWIIGNFWTEDNRDAYMPRYAGYQTPFFQGSSAANTRYLQNVAYFRCKNIQVGYNFPRKLISKAAMQALGIYLAVENPFTWSPLYKRTKDINVSNIYGADTDWWNTRPGDGGTYPTMRSWSVGINVTF